MRRATVWRLMGPMIGKPSILRRIPANWFFLLISLGVTSIILVEVLDLAQWDFALTEELPGNKNDSRGGDMIVYRIKWVYNSCCWSILLVRLLIWDRSLASP